MSPQQRSDWKTGLVAPLRDDRPQTEVRRFFRGTTVSDSLLTPHAIRLILTHQTPPPLFLHTPT